MDRIPIDLPDDHTTDDEGDGTRAVTIMAGAVLLTAPILVVFVALQRHFIAGIAAGAIK